MRTNHTEQLTEVGCGVGSVSVLLRLVLIAVGVIAILFGSRGFILAVEVHVGSFEAVDDTKQSVDVLVLLGDDAHGLVHIFGVALGVTAVTTVLDHLHTVLIILGGSRGFGNALVALLGNGGVSNGVLSDAPRRRTSCARPGAA